MNTEGSSTLASAFADRYRISRRLGEGGMAIVYLADDLRHDRQVALKVLRPELAAVLGAERFVSEIRTTASLQHPHILPLFDSGQVQADGQTFLYYVMPFVDGETLRQKIEREKQLGVTESVRIAQAIATALDYAHRRGVIHRDIKPENILLFEGQALVADFGIALAVSQAGGMRVTETGLSIGTPHYMSPEQAAADRTLDARTDIYSLGAVTFEMLAGRRPFDAPSTPAVMSKILVEPVPSLRAERASVPRNIDAAVQVALAKLPADRFASAAEFGAALGDPLFTAGSEAESETAGASAPVVTPLWKRVLWPALVALLAIIAWMGWQRTVPTPLVQRAQLDLPDGQYLSIAGSRSSPFDIARDGARLAYVADTGAGPIIFVRDLMRNETHAVVGTNGATQPFFSPDGSSIAYFAAGSLWRVSVSGGAPIVVAPAQGATSGGAWGPNDQILFAIDTSLYLINGARGTPTRVPIHFADATHGESKPSSSATRLSWPHFLPDGKHALVSSDTNTIAVDLTSNRAKHVFHGIEARYLPTGHLIFLTDDRSVRIVPFDVKRLEVTGKESPVIDNVFRGPGSGAGYFAVATESGTLVYVLASFNRTLALVDRNGRESLVPAAPRGYRFPRLSPDGRRVAVTVDPRPSDLWVVDLQTGAGERQQLPTHDGWGTWSPDGKSLVFLGNGLWRRNYPFVGEPVKIGAAFTGYYPKEWLADDQLLAESSDDIATISVRDGVVKPLVATSAREHGPTVSPDGHWLAYESDVSGVNEIYVQPYPAGGARQLVSTGGGVDAHWSRDGSELSYRRGNTIWAVPVRVGARFETLGAPQALFTAPYDFTQTGNWVTAPSGRFLMIKSDPTTTSRFQVVYNWFEELKHSAR